MPFSVRIEPELIEALRRLKERDGVPASHAIKVGTTAFLKSRGIEVEAKKGARPKKK